MRQVECEYQEKDLRIMKNPGWNWKLGGMNLCPVRRICRSVKQIITMREPSYILRRNM